MEGVIHFYMSFTLAAMKIKVKKVFNIFFTTASPLFSFDTHVVILKITFSTLTYSTFILFGKIYYSSPVLGYHDTDIWQVS